jgi:hypothetical protein
MDLTDKLAAHLLRIGGEYHDAADPDKPGAATGKQADVFNRLFDACETASICGLPVDGAVLAKAVVDATRPAARGTGSPSEHLTQWWATKDAPVPAADDATPDDMVPELDDADDVPTADNTITAPDGSTLLDRHGLPVRTVKAAERTFIQAATVQQAWEDRYNAGLTDAHGAAKASSPWSSTATRMLEALAHKRGGVTDDNMDAVDAELKPRLDKAIAKWRAEHPNHE